MSTQAVVPFAACFEDGPIDAYAKMGQLQINSYKISCSSGIPFFTQFLEVFELQIKLVVTDVQRASHAPIVTHVVKCPVPLSSSCTIGSVPADVISKSGVYSYTIVPILVDMAPITAMSSTRIFPYNDSLAPYPQVIPFAQSDPLRFPSGPFVYCTGHYGVGPCVKSDSYALRKSMIDNLPATSIPPGTTKGRAGDYQTHHVLPASCGGQNTYDNGAFMRVVAGGTNDQLPFTNWWSALKFCGVTDSTD